MNDKEYTYDIDKYTIGVDENGEDGIGLTVAKVENGEIHFLGNCYGENARCIDLLIKENKKLKEKYVNAVADYETTMSKLQELKKQLEDANEKIILLQASEPMLEWKKELEENQQKEFIKHLENEIKSSLALDTINKQTAMHIYSTTLRKYKSIIGVSDENNKQ